MALHHNFSFWRLYVFTVLLRLYLFRFTPAMIPIAFSDTQPLPVCNAHTRHLRCEKQSPVDDLPCSDRSRRQSRNLFTGDQYRGKQHMAYMRKCRDVQQGRLEVEAGDWPFLFGWLVHGPWSMDHGSWIMESGAFWIIWSMMGVKHEKSRLLVIHANPIEFGI